MSLKHASRAELEEALKRREESDRAMAEFVQLAQPDLTRLRKACARYINAVILRGAETDATQSNLIDAALRAIYGEGIWDALGEYCE